MKTTSAMTELCSDLVFIPAKRHVAHSCQRIEAVVRDPDADGDVLLAVLVRASSRAQGRRRSPAGST